LKKVFSIVCTRIVGKNGDKERRKSERRCNGGGAAKVSTLFFSFLSLLAPMPLQGMPRRGRGEPPKQARRSSVCASSPERRYLNEVSSRSRRRKCAFVPILLSFTANEVTKKK